MLQLHILFLLIIFGNIVIPFIINIYHDIFLYMTAHNEAMQLNSMVSFESWLILYSPEEIVLYVILPPLRILCL